MLTPVQFGRTLRLAAHAERRFIAAHEGVGQVDTLGGDPVTQLIFFLT